MNSNSQVHTCVVDNITQKFTPDQLNAYFNKVSNKTFAGFEGCDVQKSNKNDCYECSIYFQSAKSAQEAVDHFNSYVLDDMKFNARYEPPKKPDFITDNQLVANENLLKNLQINSKNQNERPNSHVRSISKSRLPKSNSEINSYKGDSSSEENLEPENQNTNALYAFNYMTVLNQPKDLKGYFDKKKFEINAADTKIKIFGDRANDNNQLKIHVYSKSKEILDRVIAEINIWKCSKYFLNKIIVDSELFEKLFKEKEALNRQIGEINKSAYAYFNKQSKEITIYALERNVLLKIQNLIMNYDCVKAPEKKFQKTRDSQKTFTCWVGNLGTHWNKTNWEEYMSGKAKEFGTLFSLNVVFNKYKKVHQCWLNFTSEESAKKAARFFSQQHMFGLRLMAKYNNLEKNGDGDGDGDSDCEVKERKENVLLRKKDFLTKLRNEDDNRSITSSLNSNDNDSLPSDYYSQKKYKNVIYLPHSHEMKPLFDKKKFELKDSETKIKISTLDDNLIVNISSDSYEDFEKICEKIVKEWKNVAYRYNKIKIDDINFDILFKNKEILNREVTEIDDDAYVFFNQHSKEIFAYATSDSRLLKIQSFVWNFSVSAAKPKVFTCCAGNLSQGLSKRYWEDFFNENSRSFYGFMGCEVRFKKKNNCYECSLKFDNEESVKKAMKFFFNQLKIQLKLVDNFDNSQDPSEISNESNRDEDFVESDFKDSDDENDVINNKNNNLATKFATTIKLPRARFMKKILVRKKMALEDEISNTRILIHNSKDNKGFKLDAVIVSNDKKQFDRAVVEIRRWKIFFKRIKLEENDFAYLASRSDILIQKCKEIDPDAYLVFMARANEIIINTIGHSTQEKILKAIEQILFDNYSLFISYEAQLQKHVGFLTEFLSSKYKICSNQQFEDAIKESKVVICCLSNSYIKKCSDELQILLNHGSVIFIMYEQVDLMALRGFSNAFEDTSRVIKLYEYQGSRKEWNGPKSFALVKAINESFRKYFRKSL